MAVVYLNAGKDITTNRLKAAGTEPVYIGWGTGAGVAAIADTTLFLESAEARVTGTSVRATGTTANDTWRLTGTLTASAARTITNAGCFDAATVGNGFVKGDHASTALASGESIAYTIDLRFA